MQLSTPINIENVPFPTFGTLLKEEIKRGYTSLEYPHLKKHIYQIIKFTYLF